MNITPGPIHDEESLGESDASKFDPGGSRSCSVKLQKLPPDLEFPLRFRSRISFDASRRRLQFHGLMFKRDYDQLRALSADTAYLQALDELFRNSASGSVAIDIGIDQVLEDDPTGRAAGPAWQTFKRWAARWLLLSACALSGAAFFWWYLSHLH